MLGAGAVRCYDIRPTKAVAALVSCAILVGLAVSPVLAQQVESPPNAVQATDSAVPRDEAVVSLICSTLIALNQANATGNYSVFREMGARGPRS